MANLIVKRGKKVGFDRSEGIRIPEIAINGFEKYTQATKNAKVDLYGESQDKMIEKFREYAGYSPNEFANYLNSSTAFRKNLMVTLSVTGLIEGDLILSHACNADGAKGVVRSLTLNNDSLEPYLEEMRKNDKKNGANYGQIGLAILLAGDSNFRLVRAPIMDCGAFQLVSPFMLSEAMASLRLRVLSRSVTPDNPRDISIVGKQFFDEAELKPIKEHLHAYRNLTAAINLDLQKDSALNKLFRNRKNVPHELDLVYVSGNQLHIWDLKNYELQHSFSDVRRTIGKIRVEKIRLKNLEKMINAHKAEFESYFKFKFAAIKLGIITVNLSAYNYFPDAHVADDIQVLSVDEFLKESNRN